MECVHWETGVGIELGISLMCTEWNISGCVYGLIMNVLEVVHSKTKTTKKERKKKYGKNQL